MTVEGKHYGMHCSFWVLIWYTRLPKAGEFEGKGGPETKVKMESERRPGDDDTLNLQDMKRENIA